MPTDISNAGILRIRKSRIGSGKRSSWMTRVMMQPAEAAHERGRPVAGPGMRVVLRPVGGEQREQEKDADHMASIA